MVFRKRRRPTPGFKIPPPFNPVTGDFANLAPPNVMPFCALMQVAAEDTYDDYVVCRGFDTRIGRFIDYEKDNPNKPGISVAKPYGSRVKDTYEVGSIYPAFLPLQGTEQYTPPSPFGIDIRLGQNPGVAITNVEDNGQPSNLAAFVTPLIDHNGLFVNWLLINPGEPDNDPCEDIQPGAYRAICGQTIAPGESGAIVIQSCAKPMVISAINHSNCTFYVNEKILAHVDNCCEVTFTGCKCDCTEPDPGAVSCCERTAYVCYNGETRPILHNNGVAGWQSAYPEPECCDICDKPELMFPLESAVRWELSVTTSCNENTVTATWYYHCMYVLNGGFGGGAFGGSVSFRHVLIDSGTLDWSALCSNPAQSVSSEITVDGCPITLLASPTADVTCEPCDGGSSNPDDCCNKSRWVCVNGDSRQMDFDGGDETWDVSDCCPDCTTATLRIRFSCSNGSVTLQRTYTCDGVSSIEATNVSSLCNSTAPLVIPIPTANCFLTATISAVDLPCETCDSCCDETRWFCINNYSQEISLSGGTGDFFVTSCCDCETSVLTLNVSCSGQTNTIRIDWSITCGGSLEPVEGVEFLSCDATVLNIEANECLFQVQITTTETACVECDFGPTFSSPPPP